MMIEILSSLYESDNHGRFARTQHALSLHRGGRTRRMVTRTKAPHFSRPGGVPLIYGGKSRPTTTTAKQ